MGSTEVQSNDFTKIDQPTASQPLNEQTEEPSEALNRLRDAIADNESSEVKEKAEKVSVSNEARDLLKSWGIKFEQRVSRVGERSVVTFSLGNDPSNTKKPMKEPTEFYDVVKLSIEVEKGRLVIKNTSIITFNGNEINYEEEFSGATAEELERESNLKSYATLLFLHAEGLSAFVTTESGARVDLTKTPALFEYYETHGPLALSVPGQIMLPNDPILDEILLLRKNPDAIKNRFTLKDGKIVRAE